MVDRRIVGSENGCAGQRVRRGFRPAATLVALLAAALCGVACGDGSRSESASSTTEAISPWHPPAPKPSDATFDLIFPVGYGINTAAIAAAEDVSVGSGAHVVATDGSPGAITNSGYGIAGIGSRTTAGNIVSVGDIALGPMVNATSARSSGRVFVGPGSHIGSVQQHQLLTPLVHRTLTVHTPTGTAADVWVKPGDTLTLAPGIYRDITVEPHATVTISSGTYLIDHLIVTPGAQINLNTAGGTVGVYVKSQSFWQGAAIGDPTKFILGLLGDDTLDVESGFGGTALAPNGSLVLGPSRAPYVGTFYGKHVFIGSGVTVHEAATPFLLDALTVTKTNLCLGEETEVLLGTSGAPANATMWINGVVGTHQFLKFADNPGPRSIYATVFTTDGRADFESVPITVQQCAPSPSVAPPIALHFWGTYGKPNSVDLVVHNYDANNHEVVASEAATYTWAFGDGQTVTTAAPMISHDYTTSIKPLSAYNFFTAQVTVTNAAGVASAQKVVSIFSLYALNRAKGIVQPPSSVSLSPDTYSITVTNYEPTPISITSARVDLLPCDPALPPRPQLTQLTSQTIPASSNGTVAIASPGLIAGDVCSIGVHAMGTSPAGKVYSDTYTRLRENPVLVRDVTDPGSIAILNQASAYTADPSTFDETELKSLVAQGKLSQLPTAVPPGSTYDNVGDECAPGQQSNPPGSLVCQPTADWVVDPAEVINAFAGDFLMDHGCGTIGALLSSVGQLYSHTSLFTKSRTEVRHSTASSDRINNSFDYGSLKLDADALKYGFPGTNGSTVYSIDQLANMYTLTDPLTGATLNMGGEFTPAPERCATDFTATPALVVRPSPDAPQSVLDAVSANVPTKALAVNGHYRFFQYSRADLDSFAPSGQADIAWAAGSESTVCSSFNRLAATQASLPLYPTYQATVGTVVPDGMVNYTIDQRNAGGQALYAAQLNNAESSCDAMAQGPGGIGGAILGGALGLLGGPGGVFIGAGEGAAVGDATGAAVCLDIGGNVANQLCNCFANDSCDDTGQDWKNPGPGIAVSPDDILKYDTWDHVNSSGVGGTYGYNEPSVYQAAVYRHKYVWVPVAGAGTINVQVVDSSNNPFPGVSIILNGLVQGATGSDGTLQFDQVASGTYDVEAQYDPCGLSKSPPAPPQPQPPPPPGDDVLETLPVCPTLSAGDLCKVVQIPGSTVVPSCPFSTDGTLWVNEGCVGLGPNPPVQTACACAGLQRPKPSCGLSLEDSIAAPRTLAPYGDITIKLTMCGPSPNVAVAPPVCPQYCESDADCDTNQKCDNNACVIQQRKVEITSVLFPGGSPETSIKAPGGSLTGVPIDIFCVPTLPDADGNGGGGLVNLVPPFCARTSSGDPGLQLEILVTCTESPTTGGISLVTTAQLLQGCDPDATFLTKEIYPNISPFPGGGDDPPFTLPPATMANPNPSSTLPVLIELCADSACENGADVNLLYTSEPAQ